MVHRTEELTRAIPFATRTIKDPSLARGVRQLRTRGVNGVESRTYALTIVNGILRSRQLLHRLVIRPAVTQVTAVGTKRTVSRPNCDPNYSGACVPIASDVDCAGGRGNGPAYVEGPVKVIGIDIYDLDRDGDGIGCE